MSKILQFIDEKIEELEIKIRSLKTELAEKDHEIISHKLKNRDLLKEYSDYKQKIMLDEKTKCK
jgi:hypothetical protein